MKIITKKAITSLSVMIVLFLSIGAYLCSCSGDKKTEEKKTILSDKPPVTEASSKVYSKDGILLFEFSNGTEIDTDNYVVRCILDAMIRDSGKDMDGFPCIDSRMTDEELNESIRLYADRLTKYGYTVHTSIDTRMVKLLSDAMHSELDEKKDTLPDGSPAIEGGAFCCDKKTGKTVAFISGRNANDVSSDRLSMYSYTRRPGSAIKPLILYTPLLENGYSADSYVIDKQYTEAVSNSDGTYEGKITLEYAVAKSKNTVACEMLSLFGPEKGLGYLEKMNFDYLTETDNTPFAAIGIFDNGVTIPQMCSGFTTLASGGVYHLPTCVETITDSYGNVLTLDDGLKVYSEDASNRMTDILKKTFEYGTASKLKSEGLEEAGKTGTTAGGLDGWMCGYSGDYVTVVWTGLTSSEYRGEELAGNGISGRIWKKYYESLLEGGYIVKKGTPNSNGETDPGLTPGQEAVQSSDTEELGKMIRNLIRGMSLKDKIYQLFITIPEQLGVHDEDIKKGAIEEALKEAPVGGLIFFDRHIETPDQVEAMLSAMKKTSVRYEGADIFLSVDEEGGAVVRLAGKKEFGLDNIGYIKDLTSENEVYRKAKYVGSYLNSYGFNLNFAPVVDLYYDGSVIGKRAFDSDPQIVGRYAAAFIRGLNSQNVAGCYKHFPGIGSMRDDIHKGKTEIDKTSEELKDDLFPFSTASKIGADFIMVSHARLPQILDEDIPCSMSYDYVMGILRQNLGYDGIIITDAMDMASVTGDYKSDEAAVKAIMAGCDMILMPENLDKAVTGITNAVKEGDITETRINESLFRIFMQKFKNN